MLLSIFQYLSFSDVPPMIVTITEPKIKIVQIGQEVTLRCNVDTQGQVRQYLKLPSITKKQITIATNSLFVFSSLTMDRQIITDNLILFFFNLKYYQYLLNNFQIGQCRHFMVKRRQKFTPWWSYWFQSRGHFNHHKCSNRRQRSLHLQSFKYLCYSDRHDGVRNW